MKSQVHVWECDSGVFKVSAHGTFGGGYSGMRTTRDKVVDIVRREFARYGTTNEGCDLHAPQWIHEALGA